jgi:glycosyltransferase involved in cell wall biosynthesis
MFLSEAGYEVTVFAPGVDVRKEKLFPELSGRLYFERMIDGVRVIRPRCIENFRRSMLRRLMFEIIFALGVIALLFRISRPEIIVGAYPPAVLPSAGLLMSKILRVPYIFEVRDLMADALSANRYSKSLLFNKISAWVENVMYKKSTHIVTVSDGIKRVIISKGIAPEKITPVINGYEPQVFQHRDYDFDAREKFSWQDRFVVIYAGGLTQSYDIPTLLKAAELTKDSKDILYVIIGEGEKKRNYIDHCRRESLSNVQILDAMPRKMMPALLSSANVGVHLFRDNPLWSYVLGNKPFDYLGSGIPMIYCGTGDTAELILNAKAGFVVHPERPRDLVEKICWLRDNPREAAAMGARGREFVKTNFDRFKLLEVFNDVILKIAADSVR